MSSLVAWGLALGANEALHSKSIDDISSYLAGLLRNKRVLLIMDDVWETQHAKAFQVGGRNCALLITTRSRKAAQDLAPTPNDIYVLKVLSDEKALELLYILAPAVAQKHLDALRELAHELDGLPLALQVAGRMLNKEASYGFGVSELITELRAGTKLLEATAPSDRTDTANETIPSVTILLQKSTERLDPKTHECFAVLGAFAPTPATFDLEALKTIWQMDDSESIIRSLVDRGLLESTDGRFQMHALTRLFAREQLTPVELEDGQRRLSGHYLAVLKSVETGYGQGGEAGQDALNCFDQEWPNISAGQGWAASQRTTNDQAAQWSSDYALTALAVIDRRLSPSQRLAWLEAAVDASRRLGDQIAEANHFESMGIAEDTQGNSREAIVLYRMALQMAETQDNSRLRISILNNLGVAQGNLGEIENAEKSLLRCLDLIDHIGAHPIKDEAIGNLGNIYRQKGDFESALKFHQKNLDMARERHDFSSEASALGNLGAIYTQLNQVLQALEYCEQAAILFKQLGDDEQQAIALMNKGIALDLLGRHSEALTIHEQTLEIFKRFERPRDQVGALINMGCALVSLGRQEEALRHGEQALKIVIPLGGPEAENVREHLARWLQGQP